MVWQGTLTASQRLQSALRRPRRPRPRVPRLPHPPPVDDQRLRHPASPAVGGGRGHPHQRGHARRPRRAARVRARAARRAAGRHGRARARPGGRRLGRPRRASASAWTPARSPRPTTTCPSPWRPSWRRGAGDRAQIAPADQEALGPLGRHLRLERVLLVPMHALDRQVGVMLYNRPLAAGEFTEEQLGLAPTVAGYLAVAVDNVRLMVELSTKRRDLEMVRDSSLDFAQSLDMREVLEAVVARLAGRARDARLRRLPRATRGPYAAAPRDLRRRRLHARTGVERVPSRRLRLQRPGRRHPAPRAHHVVRATPAWARASATSWSATVTARSSASRCASAIGCSPSWSSSTRCRASLPTMRSSWPAPSAASRRSPWTRRSCSTSNASLTERRDRLARRLQRLQDFTVDLNRRLEHAEPARGPRRRDHGGARPAARAQRRRAQRQRRVSRGARPGRRRVRLRRRRAGGGGGAARTLPRRAGRAGRRQHGGRPGHSRPGGTERRPAVRAARGRGPATGVHPRGRRQAAGGRLRQARTASCWRRWRRSSAPACTTPPPTSASTRSPRPSSRRCSWSLRRSRASRSGYATAPRRTRRAWAATSTTS